MYSIKMDLGMKRKRSGTLYEYPSDMSKNKESNILFSSKVRNEESDDEGIDFSKLFKRGSTEDNSFRI